MNYIKKIFVIILLIVTFSSFKIKTIAEETIDRDYLIRKSIYYISKYDIDIKVNENNSFDIKETITANFRYSKHGIIRSIPYINNITRLDGTKSSNKASLTKVKVNNQFSKYIENDNFIIKIGDPDKLIGGEVTYIINYNYNIGEDPLKEKDELYFNIIGNSWNTFIENITFKITMPKDFDSNTLGFSSGLIGSTNSNNVNYSVNNKIISGNITGMLQKNEGLNIRLELPEGYFQNMGLYNDISEYSIYILPIIFLVISIFIWLIFGRDNKVIETVEFYPPNGFNSLEIAQLYKGEADKNDVVSLLIYLANKGYIKITEIDLSYPRSYLNDFIITKLKEYDGNNIYEKKFLEDMFYDEKPINSYNSNIYNVENNSINNATINTNIVSLKNLRLRFYETIDFILSIINSNENKDKIFNYTTGKSIFIIIMTLVSFLIINLKPYLEVGSVNNDLFSSNIKSLFYLFVFSFFAIYGMFYFISTIKKKIKITNLFVIILILLFMLFLIYTMFRLILLPLLLQSPIYLYGYIIGTISIFGMLTISKYMPKRNYYGNDIYGKIKGFKRFLETVEKENLEKYVMSNPTYFYDILPFTYVLGISDLWIEKFESISIEAPTWYESSRPFNNKSFHNSINNTMKSAQRSMTSSARSSSRGGSGSSGGSSGGGSSGGGSGGGGGSSW